MRVRLVRGRMEGGEEGSTRPMAWDILVWSLVTGALELKLVVRAIVCRCTCQ